MELFRVSSHSNPNSTAGAIANVVRNSGAAELQVIGAGALNQAVKAIAIAKTFLADEAIELVCSPTFADVYIDGDLRTAIKLAVFNRLTGFIPDGLEITTRETEPTQTPTAAEPATTEPAI